MAHGGQTYLHLKAFARLQLARSVMDTTHRACGRPEELSENIVVDGQTQLDINKKWGTVKPVGGRDRGQMHFGGILIDVQNYIMNCQRQTFNWVPLPPSGRKGNPINHQVFTQASNLFELAL